MARKSGANFADQNEIRELVAGGHSAEHIAHLTNIDLAAVESWVEHFTSPDDEDEDDDDDTE